MLEDTKFSFVHNLHVLLTETYRGLTVTIFSWQTYICHGSLLEENAEPFCFPSLPGVL